MNANITYPPKDENVPSPFELTRMKIFFNRITGKMSHPNNDAPIPWPSMASLFHLNTENLPLAYQENLHNSNKSNAVTENLIPEIQGPLNEHDRHVVISMILQAHNVFLKCRIHGDPELSIEKMYASVFEKDHLSYAALIRQLRHYE